MLRALSADIIDIRTHVQHKKKGGQHQRQLVYAFLEFASEEIAEKNMKELQGKALGGSQLVVDYVGSKSSTHKEGSNKAALQVVDPKKLYVANFPQTYTK